MNQTSVQPPELSIIIAALGPYDTVRKAVKQLKMTGIQEKLEVLFVVRSASYFGLDESELHGFHSFRLIELPDLRTSGQARAVAVMQSAALVVAFVEEHTIPEPDWADALIEAHKRPCAAVGAVLFNANPQSMISWAELFVDFGPYVAPVPGGFVDNLPWHNTSYKKTVLENYGASLADMMEAEILIHWDLIAKKQQLYLEPKARTNHLNHSRLSSYIGSCFYGGWLFGAKRARYWKWSILRRALYAAGALLIPLVRLPRTWKLIRQNGRQPHLLPGVLPAVVIGLLAHAAGEGVGYAFGPGRSAEKRCDYELKRRCFLNPAEPEARNCS